MKTVCEAIRTGALDTAADLLRCEYPFAPDQVIKRTYGPQEAIRIFIRDGFIDRYTGERLVFPPVLRVISMALPIDFPYHPNWKTDVTHRAYWELSATVDHLIPVTHGGADDDSNWVTTSMARNSAKMNWTLEQLGWTLHPPRDFHIWDGLVGWFLDYVQVHPEFLANGSMRNWFKAARVEIGLRTRAL
ncbi:MAG: HNH endonuclease [Anaerolineae bacterium]